MKPGKQHTPKEATEGEQKLGVVYRPITELTLNPQNARLHTKKQVRQIADIILAFGFNVPVLMDSQGRLIAGHGRILAAQELGLHEVPTICLAHLTDAQAKTFMIADNRLTENSTWDERLLCEQFKALALVDLDFSLEVTGFHMAEIDLLIEDVTSAHEEKEDAADQVPLTPAGPPVCQLGDLWLLGPHRVYCGNALEDAAYTALMGGTRATMVITDAPYNTPIEGHASGLGRVKHRDFVMASGEMSETEFATFLTQVFSRLAAFSHDGALHYLFIDWRHLGEILSAGRQAYTELKNVCVWMKDNAGMGSLYRSQHEFVFVFKHGTAPHRNNIELGQYGRYRTKSGSIPASLPLADQARKGISSPSIQR